MKTLSIKIITLITSLFIPVFFLAVYAGSEQEKSVQSPDHSLYVGSERCASCHQIHYKGWVKTFHSTVVQDARKDPEAILGDFSDPNLPFTKGDIWFTIGGHWDQRYLTKIDDDYFVLPRLWSVQSKKWRPYSTWAWKKRPYSVYCAGCHAVAFDPETKRYGEHTIGCEACHGPGKEHSEDPVKGNIVNPGSIDEELSDMICASCHVRGKDVTGAYFYPVGYRPGNELDKYLVPLERKEGEPVRDAIARLWKKWKDDRESQARSRCEVCGIHQTAKPEKARGDATAFCLGCHEFGDNLGVHTHHTPDVEISCDDCHKQKAVALDTKKEENVHSYSYFLVHPLNCWDKDIYRYCGKCHDDRDEEWALNIFNEWRSPKETDH